MSINLTTFVASKQARYALGLLVGVIFLILIGPIILAKIELNLFNRNLIHLWGLEPQPLSAGFCVESTDKQALRKLDAMAKRNPVDNLHRGMMACLKGDKHAAEELWLTSEQEDDVIDSMSVFWTALVAFTENRIIDTPHADDLGNYAKGIGYQLARQEEEKEAAAWYQFAFAYSPNISIAKSLTDAYKKNGNHTQIKEVWQQLAAKTDEQTPDHWWALGQLAELDKDWENAVTFYRRGALLPDADAFKFSMHLGQLYSSQKQYVQASRWFGQASQEKPQSSLPYYFLGLAARGQKQYAEALSYFDQALLRKPEDASSLFYKAVTLDDMQRREEASKVLAQAIEHHKKPPQSWLDLQEKWRRYPDYTRDPDRWWERGRDAEKEKNWANAAVIYHEGAQLAQPPDDYRLLEREALMQRHLKQWAAATAIYEDLVQRYPDKINGYIGRGETARAQKKYDEAKSWFRQAQQRFPDDHRPPYYLGLTARAQKNYEDALDRFDRSLALKPDNPNVLYQKALTLKAIGQREQAIETLRQAIDLHPKHPQSWLNLLEKWQEEAN